MAQVTRRVFIASAATASAAFVLGVTALGSAQGLGQFGSGPPPCDPNKKPTPKAAAGPDYKPGAPQRTSLVEAGVTGTKIVVTGTVSGVTCGPIKGAQL